MFGHLGDGAVDHAVQHHRLEAQRARVFELGDGLVRRVHGNHSRRRDAVLERLEEFGLVGVECAARSEASFVVVHPRQAESHGGEQDAEVDAEFVETLVEQARHHGGGAVAGVLGGRAPEGLLGNVLAAALCRRHAEGTSHPLAVHLHRPHCGVAADLAHGRPHHGGVFEPVAVGVDDGMAQARSEFRCFAHGLSPLVMRCHGTGVPRSLPCVRCLPGTLRR
ncbi:MAG: hypothetical protein F4Y26_14490 [Gammaproteobacteria bacterium]|nr:hypothetical protein [Gammaproteobacteria bacterium]